MSFQIKALSPATFQHLFPLSSQELAAHGAVRVTANKQPGFPCRVSLADAEVGEELLLVHYEHHSADSPFRASHAVYVRPGAVQANLSPDEIPLQLRFRILSLRGFDQSGMLLRAELAEGTDLESAIESVFAIPAIAYIHLHYAKPGCYAASVHRSTQEAPGPSI